MLFRNITIVDEFFKIQRNVNVVIKDDKIEYIGKDEPHHTSDIYDGSRKLLMPGFVNTHAHTPMTLMRGYCENKVLADWLNNYIFPFEDKMTEQDVYNGMMLGIAESLRFGIVSTTDMYFKCDKMCEAAINTNTKLNISDGMVCFDNGDLKDNNAYRETEKMLLNYNRSNGEKIIVDASIHGEYTSNPEIVAQMVEYAKINKINMHLHLSETKSEHDDCVKRRGKTPAQYFNDLGAFDLNTTAAHCVHITDNDIDILKNKNVTAASNPVSNLKLASGVAPVAKMIEKGVNVSIGTDGMASNNNLNILEDIKIFAILHKGINYDPCLISPAEAIKSATYNGSKAQGRHDCGLIKAGYKADLIVVDTDKPYYYPEHDALNNLVYSGVGTDICLTMVDGKILYQDGEYTTLDIEKIKYDAEISVKNILDKL